MSQYRIRILNHTVMGYPYVPICKFQISSTSKSKIDKTQQSPFVNPPLYNPKLDGKQKQPVSTPSTDSAYMKQFPIEFQQLTFAPSEELEIKLIELTRNGREKMIGYSKIIINAAVLGKSTRHKIIQIGQQPKVSKQGIKNQHVISIVQVSFAIANNRDTSEGKKAKIVKQDVPNPFKIQQSNTSQDSSSSSQDQRKKSLNSSRQKYDEPQSDTQNQRVVFDNSKGFVKSPVRNNSNSSFKQQYFVNSKDQSLSTINHPKMEENQQTTSRRVLHHKPSDSSVESSYPISRQSRVHSNERLSGKIVKQKPNEKTIEKTIQPIEEAPIVKQTEYKHKRRLKYIFNSSEFGGVGPVTFQQKAEGLKNKNHNKEQLAVEQNTKQSKKRRKAYLQRMHTQANPTMPTQLVEYFISNDQTDQNGCNLLNNLNIVYESSFGPFYPKYITFLTHKLYESIMRINCEELKNHPADMNESRQEDQYLLETQEGQLYEPQVYNKFSKLKLYLPKYCLMLRVQIIMEDESVYVGTLANQCGVHLKCVLQLKKTANMQNIQIKKQKERINMIVNIAQKIVNKESSRSPSKVPTPRIQPKQIALPSSLTTKNLGKGKSRFEDERFFPQIARRLHTEQNKADAYVNYSVLNETKSKKEISPVERTLHAINSYKNILTSQDDTKNSLQRLSSSPNNRLNRKEYINNHDPYVEPIKPLIEPRKKLQSSKTKSIQSIHHTLHHTPQQVHFDRMEKQNDEPTQEELAQLLTSKRTYHKDLPKITVQRSSKYNLNEARKQTILQNLQSELGIKTRKRKNSSKQDGDFSKDKSRLNYFKKVLNNKYGEYVSLNRQISKRLLELSTQKRTRKSRSKQCFDDQKRKQRKIIRVYNKDLNYTKVFPSSIDRSAIRMVSCHDKCIKEMPSTKELKQKKKKHLRSNSSLHSLADKTKSDFKKAGRFNILIKKLEYLKLVEQEKGPKISSKKFKSPGDDSENERWEDGSNAQKQQEPFEVFLKVYSESKRQRQFITPSQKLIPAFSNPYPIAKMQSPSEKNLNYLITSWNVKESQFLFKNIKVTDMITIEAYGDMSSVDNHEFMGRCIFTVQEMSFMRIQKKITGYLVKNKKIESHCTLHFDIEEVV